MDHKHLSLKCPDKKTLLDWAITIHHERNVELFQHILQCSDCQSELKLELEYILYIIQNIHAVPNEDEVIAVKKFLNHKKQNEKRWKNLEKEVVKIQRNKMSCVTELAETPLKDTNHDLYSNDSEELIIMFAADCSQEDSAYWRAEIRIPPKTQHHTILLMSVNDARNRPVMNGTFFLCDKQFSVIGGIVKLTFEQFLENIKTHTVKLFFNGNESEGHLVYFINEE